MKFKKKKKREVKARKKRMLGQTRNIFLPYLISYIAFSTKPGHHKMEEVKFKKNKKTKKTNTFSKEYYFCEDFKKTRKIDILHPDDKFENISFFCYII